MSSAATSGVADSAAPSSQPPILVGIAGATGVVGQRFLSLLDAHPYFRAVALSASERSAGKCYGDVAAWKLAEDMPTWARDLQVLPTTVEAFKTAGVRLVFSALDASIAGEIEEQLAQAGIAVFSNARNHRYDARVPILIPHANSEHLDILPAQIAEAGYAPGGFIVTNANCSSTGLVVALRPLRDRFGLDSLFVTTLQAISGAGYPGVASLDITDNVVPFISGEEPKMEMEPQKILGTIGQPQMSLGSIGQSQQSLGTIGQPQGGAGSEGSGRPVFVPAGFKVSAQCNRVAVIDGHMECVSVKFATEGVTVEQVEQALREWQSEAQTLHLPSAPKNPIFVHSSDTRPQPRLDRDRERGFVVTVGRVRPCSLLHFKFVLCSHNTVLGAAGGSILNAELAVAKGYLK